MRFPLLPATMSPSPKKEREPSISQAYSPRHASRVWRGSREERKKKEREKKADSITSCGRRRSSLFFQVTSLAFYTRKGLLRGTRNQNPSQAALSLVVSVLQRNGGRLAPEDNGRVDKGYGEERQPNIRLRQHCRKLHR